MPVANPIAVIVGAIAVVTFIGNLALHKIEEGHVAVYYRVRQLIVCKQKCLFLIRRVVPY